MKGRIWVCVACLAVVGVMAACGEAGEPTAPMGVPGLSGKGNQDRGPLERVQFIHWKKGFAKPGGGGGGKPGSSCYAFIARGARWSAVEPWEVFGQTADDGIGASAVQSRVGSGVVEWERNLSPSGDILGGGSLGSTRVDLNASDDRNVVEFGTGLGNGVIAITNVWGFFSGPTRTREIVEWDMVLAKEFTWTTTGEAGKMDLLNIVVHELGHAMGMGHPSDSCTEETMYRFATEGETKKRDLFTGDIAGINDLY